MNTCKNKTHILIVVCSCLLLASCFTVDYFDSENVYSFQNNSTDTVVLHGQYAPWVYRINEPIADSLILIDRVIPPARVTSIAIHFNNLTDTFLPSDAIRYLYVLTTAGDTLCKQNPIIDSTWIQDSKTTTINDGFYISYVLNYPY